MKINKKKISAKVFKIASKYLEANYKRTEYKFVNGAFTTKTESVHLSIEDAIVAAQEDLYREDGDETSFFASIFYIGNKGLNRTSNKKWTPRFGSFKKETNKLARAIALDLAAEVVRTGL